MKWTRRKPDKPGWWWYRVAAETIRVDGNVSDGLTINGCNIKEILRGMSGEWSSEPIPEPDGRGESVEPKLCKICGKLVSSYDPQSIVFNGVQYFLCDFHADHLLTPEGEE